MVHIWKRRTPLLGKEGWLRPLKKCREASLAGADGWSVQATDYRKLNEPFFLASPYRAYIRSAHARPRLQRNGTIYLMARPPLLCQGGEFAFLPGCLRP